MSVRGDMSVEMSPALNPSRVRLATVTIWAVIEAGEISLTDRVRCGEKPEACMGRDDSVLVQQREASIAFEEPLDDEHDIGTPGVKLVEEERDGLLGRPGKDAFLKLGDLLALAQDDAVASHEIKPRDVTVEIDADQRPTKTGGNLFEVGGLATAVRAVDEDPPIVHEAGKNCGGDIGIEAVRRIDLGHMFLEMIWRVHGLHLEGSLEAKRLFRIDRSHRWLRHVCRDPLWLPGHSLRRGCQR